MQTGDSETAQAITSVRRGAFGFSETLRLSWNLKQTLDLYIFHSELKGELGLD